MSDANQQTRKIIVDESRLLGIQCVDTPNGVKNGVKVGVKGGPARNRFPPPPFNNTPNGL